jgi:uncharacterized protein (TIGR02391 family)
MRFEVQKYVADFDALQAMPVPLLAEILFFHLRTNHEFDNLHRQNNLTVLVEGYHRGHREAGIRIWCEAWAYLEHQGLLATHPGGGHESQFITRLGESVKSREDFTSYTRGALLPDSMLHMTTRREVKPLFLQGKYETAVLEAYRQVEIKVRDEGKYAPEDIGVTLMRKAFDSDNGPLCDPSLPKGEREAMAHLFAGAIGLFKNAASHRQPTIYNAEHAAHQILIADELLQIATERAVGLSVGVQRPPGSTHA